MRKIDRKLKACHNPLFDPESDIFKQQAAAAQQQVKEDRDSKVQPCKMLLYAAPCNRQCLGLSWCMLHIISRIELCVQDTTHLHVMTFSIQTAGIGACSCSQVAVKCTPQHRTQTAQIENACCCRNGECLLILDSVHAVAAEEGSQSGS